jgi:signal transduction histidine kinase
VLVALGAAAAVAVENSRLYEAARRQQRWIQASAEVTTRLLSGSEPGEVLAGITRQARELSGADLAVLALPDEEGRRLTITYADGDGADVTRGLVLPAGESLSGRVQSTSRAEAERLSLYQDRDRIARDLHDLVIQRLYATGMSLEGTMPMITRPQVASRITNAVDAMDETIKDIRATIFALQAHDAAGQPYLRGDIVVLVEGDETAVRLRAVAAPGRGSRCAGQPGARRAGARRAARGPVQRGQAC